MVPALWIAAAGLSGCAEEEISISITETCASVSSPVAWDDASLGFSADDVATALDALPRPTRVAWDETLGAPEDSVVVSFAAARNEQVTLETPDDPACGPSSLRLPIDVTLDIGGGQIVGEKQMDLWAPSTDLEGSYFSPSVLDVTLSGDAAALATAEAANTPEPTIVRTTVDLCGPTDDRCVEVTIWTGEPDAQGDNPNFWEGAWFVE